MGQNIGIIMTEYLGKNEVMVNVAKLFNFTSHTSHKH